MYALLTSTANLDIIRIILCILSVLRIWPLLNYYYPGHSVNYCNTFFKALSLFALPNSPTFTVYFNMQTGNSLLIYSDLVIALLPVFQGSLSQSKSSNLTMACKALHALPTLPLPPGTYFLANPSLTLHHTSLLAFPKLLFSSAHKSLPQGICIVSSFSHSHLCPIFPFSKMPSLITLFKLTTIFCHV